jgi:hypothetical protein
VQRASTSRALATDAVRMSFRTERPFFPYREPRDQRESNAQSLPAARSLRVFFFGRKRAAGTIGEGTAPFSGKTVWAAPALRGRQGRVTKLHALSGHAMASVSGGGVPYAKRRLLAWTLSCTSFHQPKVEERHGRASELDGR